MHSDTERSKTPGTWRERQKSETRAVILENAQSLFEVNGFDGTTIRMVAAAAGVGVGTIFSHFPDKKSLLSAVLIEDLDRANRKAWAAMPQAVSVREKMLHLAREVFLAWLQRPALSRTLIREMCFATSPARGDLQILDRRAVEQVAGLLEHAQRQGEIRSDVDPGLVARIAFSFYLTAVLSLLDDLESSSMDGRDPDNSDPIVEETQLFLDYLFDGIGYTKQGVGE